MRAGLEGRGLGDLGEAAIRGFFVGFLALSLGDGILERMTIGMCSLLWQSYCREDLRVLRVSSTPRQHGKRCLRPIHLPRRRSSRMKIRMRTELSRTASLPPVFSKRSTEKWQMMSVHHSTADATTVWAIRLKSCWNENEWSCGDEFVMRPRKVV